MRNLIYLIADGREVKTYAEAKATGMRFVEILENADMANTPLSEKRKALLKENGVIIPKGEYHKNVLMGVQ